VLNYFVNEKAKSEEAAAVATIQDEQEAEEDEGSVMLTIVPNEDGEMVAVPVHVEGEDDDKMEVNMDNADNVDSQVPNLLGIYI
jgi:hypothetical protein